VRRRGALPFDFDAFGRLNQSKNLACCDHANTREPRIPYNRAEEPHILDNKMKEPRILYNMADCIHVHSCSKAAAPDAGAAWMPEGWQVYVEQCHVGWVAAEEVGQFHAG